ncbi:hypothetical protein RJ639_022274 [Escallonia herrerae]|uniref:Uncharacterized protein n=1 Tax=Escallonia herrerae TaxID=1293975 RepID=A0AA88V6F4_9ASTE|nr:hypothetical protein RJ639_022274 [Escallonia herrerae]
MAMTQMVMVVAWGGSSCDCADMKRGHGSGSGPLLERGGYVELVDQGEGADGEEADLIHRNDQQQFLATVDFLSTYGMTTLISSMQEAATDVLKGKRLQDIFNTTLLHETIVQILDVFMSMEGPHSWVDYLMPEASGFYKRVSTSSTKNINISDLDKFDQLMMETRSRVTYGNVTTVGHMCH